MPRTKLSGVRPFVLYSLRYSFATRFAPQVDACTLCKIMGWASLSVAMRYIHPSDEQRNAIIGQLGEALKVALSAPSVDGRANEACIEFLAEMLQHAAFFDQHCFQADEPEQSYSRRGNFSRRPAEPAGV